MNCEILCVGTELLLGNTVNTNAAELGDLLSAMGIDVLWHSVVGDNPGRLREAAEIAKDRADLIVVTGGLGPTYDDLTKNVLAECFGRPLEYHPEVEEGLRRFFAQKKSSLPFTENNLQQCWLPKDCTVFQNDWGTAPGCAFESDGTRVIMLPGPPNECLPMFRHRAVPYLQSLTNEVLVSHQIHVFGQGESSVEQLFREQMKDMKNPSLATYAKATEVMLRVTAKAADEQTAEEMCRPVIRQVCDTLGAVVYSVDTDGLEAVCLPLLKEKGKTFAVAESLTAGLIGARFAALSGASAVFRGGAITYCDEVKAGMLGIDPALIAAHGAVSRETAEQMAIGTARAAGADIGLSATGLAGPLGDGSDNPVGTVYVGLAADGQVWVRHLRLGTIGRSRIRTLAASHAFDMLRRYLTGLPILEERYL